MPDAVTRAMNNGNTKNEEHAAKCASKKQQNQKPKPKLKTSSFPPFLLPPHYSRALEGAALGPERLPGERFLHVSLHALM